MATLAIRRVSVQASFVGGTMERVQRRLAAGARPVDPVVNHFARALAASIDDDFRVGGRSPFVWKPDARNTIAAKGHGRILEGKNGPKLRKSIRVEVVASRAPLAYAVDVHVPRVGEFHQLGRTTPWTIAPKPGKFLRFEVAEKQEDFRARRRTAQLRRRNKVKAAGRSKTRQKAAVRSTRIPSRPDKIVVFTPKPVKHPGYPARKFVVVRQGLIQTAWREPLGNFLFRGVTPS